MKLKSYKDEQKELKKKKKQWVHELTNQGRGRAKGKEKRTETLGN
jgi:uncharacterized membrane-anchored protein